MVGLDFLLRVYRLWSVYADKTHVPSATESG